MAFVLLLVISMATLVKVESRSAQTDVARIEAEQAAFLSLQVAIGELQKAAGPDQRVTATASINQVNPAQPHLLGVWDSFKQANDASTTIDYAAQKNRDFKQWLSSTRAFTERTDQAYAAAAPIDAVTLVGSGTLPTPDVSDFATQYIQASVVDVLGAGGYRTGGYAWHIFDESQKANLILENPVTSTSTRTATDGERVSALGFAGKPNFTALARAGNGNGNGNAYLPLENLTAEDQGKVASLGSTALLGGLTTFAPREANAFHILTTDSKGLLVDVANGGFQKDLSLLFENEILPTTYANRHIYSESEIPLESAPDRFTGAEPIPSPDPTWSLLKSHYDLFKTVSNVGGTYNVDASEVERDKTTGYFEKQQLLPVVSNAQFIFSMGTEKRPQPITSRGSSYEGFLVLWTDVVLTLWNPYNVELNVNNGMEIEFYRFPLEVQFFKETTSGGWESASSGEFVHISQMFRQVNNQFNDAHVQDRLPYRARIVNEFTLKPGEYRVFSPSSVVLNHKNENYTKGMELEEGFVAGGKGGGVGATYIAVDSSYRPLSQWQEMTSSAAQIHVNPGDTLGVAVQAGKINRNASFSETNDEEIVAYLKTFQGDGGAGNKSTNNLNTVIAGLDQNRVQVGAIEIDLKDAGLQNRLPSYDVGEMAQLTINPSEFPLQGVYWNPASVFHHYKKPFLIASLRLKTELDSDSLDGKPNGSVWLHNGITNQYFSDGLKDDQQSPDDRYHQYEITWEPMTDWTSTPAVEYNPTNNRGFGGSGVTSGTGVEFAPFHQIPLVPATSIAQFSHAPLNAGGQAPLTSQIVANSFSSPLLSLAQKSRKGAIGVQLDHSYMANNTLFDSYFLSSAAEEVGPLYGSSGRSLDVVVSEFLAGSRNLPNSNFEPANTNVHTITASDYSTFAQHIYNRGAFNVNSTSVEAWALFLASGTTESLPILDMLTASTAFSTAAISSDVEVSRFAPLIGDEEAAIFDGQSRWQGHRRLTPDQIMTLAQNVVAEVKARGPFQSVAEFVNRQLVNETATGNSGALQTAIENSNLNTNFGRAVPKNNNELNSGSFSASASDGAATQITQADLLNRLAPSLSVRGDTFRIRAYGESTSMIGDQTAQQAWCEAVVQRQHDFVDDSDTPTTAIDSLQSVTNQAFGRRFKIVSFRWLSNDEV